MKKQNCNTCETKKKVERWGDILSVSGFVLLVAIPSFFIGNCTGKAKYVNVTVQQQTRLLSDTPAPVQYRQELKDGLMVQRHICVDTIIVPRGQGVVCNASCTVEGE